jgi:hypothetical protein
LNTQPLRSDAPELPALVRKKIAKAIREFYDGAYLIDGDGLQVLVLHSEVGDPRPLTSLLMVLPENKITADYIEHVNVLSYQLWEGYLDLALAQLRTKRSGE